MAGEQNVRRPLEIKDLQHIVVPSAASLSADSRYVVYVTTTVLLDENTYQNTISVVDAVTNTEQEAWDGASPKWSPVSNEIAYLSEQNGVEWIWIYSLETKEHRPVAPVYESHYFLGHLALKDFEWSPDGSMIAYISASSAIPDSGDKHVKIADRILYKTKGGRGRPDITDNAFSHLWIVDVRGGKPIPLTSGPYNDHSLSWSPDSQRIAFVSNRSADADNNQRNDLWSVQLSNQQITRRTENFGTVYQPVWSPDGQQIAFLGTTSRVSTNDSPAEDTHLYVLSTATNGPVCLTRAFDRRIEQISWDPLEARLYFTAGNEGTTALYRVTADGSNLEKLLGEECQVLEYRVDASGKWIVYVRTDAVHPPEVFMYDQQAGHSRQLTHLNEKALAEIRLQPATSFWFSSFDGTKVQGWLIKPYGFTEGGRYPLVLVIHGGPHNMFGYGFEERQQVLSGQGFAVLCINPRGSSGYGQQFSSGCVKDWGGGDYRDLIAGVDAAISQNNWIDADRLAVTGQSYGGYMTNWIITQTNRFRAAVSDGGISNLISFAGTSLYHSLMESEFGAPIYDNFDVLWKCSPLKYVKKVKTPTLFLHGEKDNEVPVSQAEELFVALRKQGIDSRLVQYIGEGHGWRPDLLPQNRYDVLTRMVDWLKNYCPSETNRKPQP
ncbi:dipeptidyl aminopeptidase/acylaminoacyl peptidase [Larkinella arboricola]|uniref:Dipeptidyl aminopeptidase/acylaminoacyl peptidase n=1 Tax=Larkinella arboricola TaxID=643671 RepID=A0A327WKS7_LARAB|nr:S9 family peptidase [Larkinella arboricola]RAJ90693.1 dipeptidyl aminopeptidase/acylaminoacyl peptidase [Larkinella arboricola]